METGIMVRDKKTDQNNRDGEPNNNSEDLIKLLKSFYQNEKNEMQDFEDFFGSIEKKLDEQNPVTKIMQTNMELEQDYKLRQNKLEESINRLENNLKLSHDLIKKKSARLKMIFIGAGILAILIVTFFISF